MMRTSLLCMLVFFLSSCEHRGEELLKFTGEYRYFSGIGEFFDCESKKKYYISKLGIDDELQSAYLKQNMNDRDDVFMQIEGYFKEEPQMEGIDPATVFVPVRLLKVDKNRGCQRAIRRGN